jgi:hypothetical protein
MPDEHQIYSDDRTALGIVSSAEVAEDALELARGEDPNPEHYRWRRFVKFVHDRPTIDAALATSLYELGERDPDRSVGESIMSTVIRREDCPRQLHEKAMLSSSKHLNRGAAARLNAEKG